MISQSSLFKDNRVQAPQHCWPEAKYTDDLFDIHLKL